VAVAYIPIITGYFTIDLADKRVYVRDLVLDFMRLSARGVEMIRGVSANMAINKENNEDGLPAGQQTQAQEASY